MIPARIYSTVFLLIVALLTAAMSMIYGKMTRRQFLHRGETPALTGYIVALSFALFIGIRPLSGVFVDMMNYNSFYHALYFGRDFTFDSDTQNLIFDNLMVWLASNRYGIEAFFLIISLIYFIAAYWAMRKLFPRDALYAFIAFLGAFSTFSYATNGIKAGAAASLFLCALAVYKKPLWAAIFLALSLGFHHSMVLPIVAFIVCALWRNPKYYITVWVISLVISLLHITAIQEIFASMSDEGGASYLNAVDNDWGGKTGFRYDFVLYSFAPIAVGWWAIFKKGLKSNGYNFIINTYTLTNSVWMLCMYANFTNRIAYLSWLMYPVVLVFPFMSKEFMPRQNRALNIAVWGQLLFTLAMSFIYYG